MAKRKKDVFDDMGRAAVGLGGVGLATGVGATAASKAGVAGLGGGFSALTGLTGVATTVYMGGSVLKPQVSSKRFVTCRGLSLIHLSMRSHMGFSLIEICVLPGFWTLPCAEETTEVHILAAIR